jgi:hypothetical protein
MPKQKPPGTVTHTIFLPNAVHKQVAAVAGHGGVDDLIIECVTEAMKPRWAKWLKQEYKKLSYDADSENGQRTIRRSSPPDAKQASTKNRKNSRQEEGR